MPEWLVLIGFGIMWLQGFITAGIIWAPGPFWDGVRDVYSWPLKLWNR